MTPTTPIREGTLKLASSITADEVQQWFGESLPAASARPACEIVAMNFSGAHREWEGRRPKRKQRPKGLKSFEMAFDRVYLALQTHAQFLQELAKIHEEFPEVKSPLLASEIECIQRLISDLRHVKPFLNSEILQRPHSEFQRLVVWIATQLLMVWNSGTNRTTKSIGRETPLELALHLAVKRITGRNYEMDSLRSELSRADWARDLLQFNARLTEEGHLRSYPPSWPT